MITGSDLDPDGFDQHILDLGIPIIVGFLVPGCSRGGGWNPLEPFSESVWEDWGTLGKMTTESPPGDPGQNPIRYPFHTWRIIPLSN